MAMPELRAIQANITTLQVNAIVNAANTSLLGGGGVDGAIHRAAGPDLLEACRRIGRCPVGQARITPGFKLAAKYIIHTVGPYWQDGLHGESQALASCYQNSLTLADEHRVQSMAFPCISTGAYRYPPKAAAEIAVNTVKAYLAEDAPHNHHLQEIIFCCFSAADLAIYQHIL